MYIYPHRFDDRFKKIHVKTTILGAGRKKIILETWQQIQTTLSSTLSKENGPLRNLVLHERKESEQIAWSREFRVKQFDGKHMSCSMGFWGKTSLLHSSIRTIHLLQECTNAGTIETELRQWNHSGVNMCPFLTFGFQPTYPMRQQWGSEDVPSNLVLTFSLVYDGLNVMYIDTYIHHMRKLYSMLQYIN